MCDMIAKSLYAAGYEVDTCYDGKEALECILSENYDLIVLDLNLPGMDGMELLKELSLIHIQMCIRDRLQVMYLWLPFVFEILITILLSKMNVEAANEKLRREKGIE